MWLTGSTDRIDGNTQCAVGTIFESYRGRQAGGQLTVNLAFCGSGTNRSPANQVSDVLRRNQIKKLGGCRDAQTVDIQQQFTGDIQPLVDLITVIQIRIINQSLPTYGGTWLFKINPHDD